MRLLIASAVLLSATHATAKPTPEVHTGTNTNRETAQPMWTEGGANSGQMEVAPTDAAVAVGRGMATCFVSSHPREVKAALAAENLDQFRLTMKRLSDALGNCMSYSSANLADVSNMELAPNALAGLLAEAWFARNGVPAIEPAKYDANAPKLDAMAGSAGSVVQFRLGECLAQTQPEAVAALVRAAPSSPQELVAFQALVPTIPTCLDKNVTLKATKTSLRLALAFALYRRTVQPVNAGAAN